MMQKGDRVKIVSLNGTVEPPKSIDPSENYWVLVGEIGIIQQDPSEKHLFAHFSKEPRVLVQFDENLITQYITKYKLHIHNNIKNSLWILVSDLELVDE